MVDNTHVVTGLWAIREDRPESKYLAHFKNLLSVPMDMTVYIPPRYESLVMGIRSGIRNITTVRLTELKDIRSNYFGEHWNAFMRVWASYEWQNSVSWLKNTPQSFSEWYNPIVMSKVYFLHDAFQSHVEKANRYIWVDAGITQHIPADAVNKNSITNFSRLTDAVTFSSFDYIGQNEVHGFAYEGFTKYTKEIPSWVCRATLFSSTSEVLQKFRDDYRYYLQDTLERRYMGTEESIFTLLSMLEPNIYRAIPMGNEPTGMPTNLLRSVSHD